MQHYCKSTHYICYLWLSYASERDHKQQFFLFGSVSDQLLCNFNYLIKNICGSVNVFLIRLLIRTLL